MPELRKPKYEKFARLVASGVSQAKSYEQAGYAPNDGAASRLAHREDVAARIEELKLERFAVAAKHKSPNMPADVTTLFDMGFDLRWVAEQYQTIYTEAMELKQLASANKAVENIQKMVNMENDLADKEGKIADKAGRGDRIALQDVTAMLKEVRLLSESGKADPDEEPVADPGEDAEDITPLDIVQTLVEDTA
jgi:hypothetical protein